MVAVDERGQRETIVALPKKPSGLGWLPGGDLLVVSMEDRRLLRFDGREPHQHADLRSLAPFYCNDMVVEERGYTSSPPGVGLPARS